MIQNSANTFRQTNAFAMNYGAGLAVWGFTALALMTSSFMMPSLSSPAIAMFYGSPVFAGFLTTRFRHRVAEPSEGFPFGRAFLFTFMMGVYAALLIATFVFIYLSYFDDGTIWRGFEERLSRPEVAESLANSMAAQDLAALGFANGPADIVAAMRSIPAAGYATMIIYTSLLVAPVISCVIALLTRRHPQNPM